MSSLGGRLQAGSKYRDLTWTLLGFLPRKGGLDRRLDCSRQQLTLPSIFDGDLLPQSFLQKLHTFSRNHWLIFIVNKRTDDTISLSLYKLELEHYKKHLTSGFRASVRQEGERFYPHQRRITTYRTGCSV